MESGAVDDDRASVGAGADLDGFLGRAGAVGGVEFVAHHAGLGVQVQPGGGALPDADLQFAGGGFQVDRAAHDLGQPDVAAGGLGVHVAAGALHGDVAVGGFDPQV